MLSVSVWPCAQADSKAQRKGRYLPEYMAHPGKMLPAIAEHAITHYTQPGDLVVDPMAGIGTTLVEAVHADRMALGVEYEPRWADLARRNVEHATDRGAPGYAVVVQGDARDIVRLVGSDTVGKAALVLTSPPYEDSLHRHVRCGHGSSLTHRNPDESFIRFREILEGCYLLLKPGGHLAMTSRPKQCGGKFCDLPSRAWQSAIDAGFELLGRYVALLSEVRDDDLVNAADVPAHLPRHEEVHILTKPANSEVVAQRVTRIAA
ncbi:site-specific DNA-methyltransferase [Catenulispora sp. NL8]|uniref:Methyltransferase n=2 Tax=Catenulispora pinistramenti TaxID=2705254 RepID=A0ABS5KJA7_9ACTN|nr:site-specific DNA-methyltransferase [Catenulispora pinistramenti]